jgi:PilZ domain-containing protein
MDFISRIMRRFAEEIVKPLPDTVAGSLSAFYWEGAASARHSVRNVSLQGADIITLDKWYPGTIINLTLQCGVQTAGEGGATQCKALTMRSKVVAHSQDGVRVAFLYLNRNEREAARKFLDEIRTGGGQ